METGRKLSELVAGMSKMPQEMVNVKTPDPQAAAEHPELLKAVALKEECLSNRGRVLVRPSGTEPVLRVMVEGEDAQEVRSIANELALVVESNS